MSQKVKLKEFAPVAGAGSDQGPEVELRDYPAVVYVELDVSSKAAAGTDTLDVWVQTKVGNDWLDVIHFTQAVGNTSPNTYVNKCVADLEQAEFDTATALNVKEKRHVLGSLWRARWTTAGGTAAFDFEITLSAESRDDG